MNRRAAAALIARNALACEEARTEKCVCSCGGKFHGAAHAKSWQREQVDLIADGEDPHQVSLLESLGLGVLAPDE